MTEATAREMLALARDIDARLDAVASDMAEIKATTGRIETKLDECLAIAAQAARQPLWQDQPRRLH